MSIKKYEIPQAVKKNIWQIWHQLLIRFDKNVSVDFINYGYDSLNGEQGIDLLNTDEPNRYCIQLYDQLVNKIDIYNQDVLEIGSGRGGGASYIMRYYQPKSYTGLEISGRVTDFCNRYYTEYGLSFVKGDAANLPFKKKTFDTVLCIESARNYVNPKKFFNEVYKVVRKGGCFLYSDVFEAGELDDIKRQMGKAGFKLQSEKNITSNTITALDKDRARRVKLVEDKVPGFLKKAFTQFSGIKGTERYNSFKSGKSEYWSFVLRKN